MVAIVAKSDTFPASQQPNSPRIVTLGNPGVAGGNALTSWGVPVVDPGVPLLSYSPGTLAPRSVWESQPSVRKVVDFIARQCASVPWHAYVRVSDTDRQRVKGSRAEARLSLPSKLQTGYDLWHKVVVDKCLYDRWCVVLRGEVPQRVPASMLRFTVDSEGNTVGVWAAPATSTSQSPDWVDLTVFPLAFGWGWSDGGGGGISPMSTLSAVLTENRHAVEWRNALWVNGPKTSGVLTRPAGAPDWTQNNGRDRFVQTWRSFRDSKAGGTPILEDGMDFKPIQNVTPNDAKDIEGRQLTDVEVCSAFHIAPELVGARQGTFSNVAAFRQMLFGPALGPHLEELQQAVNASLVASLDATEGVYVELDREAAMNGSFLEQAAVMSTAIGGPWMTRNEGRAKQNLPAVDGGDALITPLNVTEGGQASPRDSGSQNRGTGDPNAESAAPKAETRALFKAAASSAASESLQAKIAALYRRQIADVEQGVPVDPALFHDQWDALAADAVHDHMFGAAAEGAQASLQQLAAPAGSWSADVMRNYVREMAETVGAGVTATAVQQINAAEWPADPDRPEDGPAKAGLAAALGAVAGVWAVSALTNARGFGAHDGAHAAGARTKTWVTGVNPRPAHAAIDGETVDFDGTFSIGVRWPGDSIGELDTTVACNCGVSFSV